MEAKGLILNMDLVVLCGLLFLEEVGRVKPIVCIAVLTKLDPRLEKPLV